MAKYKVAYWIKRDKIRRETEPVSEHGMAVLPSGVSLEKCKVVTILRDSEGEDHPANAGKWFLHRIVK